MRHPHHNTIQRSAAVLLLLASLLWGTGRSAVAEELVPVAALENGLYFHHPTTDRKSTEFRAVANGLVEFLTQQGADWAPAQVYRPDGTQSDSHEISLDENGRASVSVAPGEYLVRISAAADSGSRERLTELIVRFTSCDTEHMVPKVFAGDDDSPALQFALCAASDGGTVSFPIGKRSYRIARTVEILGKDVTLRGDGVTLHTDKELVSGSLSQLGHDLPDESNSLTKRWRPLLTVSAQRARITQLKLQGPGSGASDDDRRFIGICSQHFGFDSAAHDLVVELCEVARFDVGIGLGGYNKRVSNCHISNNAIGLFAIGLRLAEVSGVQFRNNPGWGLNIQERRYAARKDENDNDILWRYDPASGEWVLRNHEYKTGHHQSQNILIATSQFESNHRGGGTVDNASLVTLSNCWFEAQGPPAPYLLKFQNGARHSVERCTFQFGGSDPKRMVEIDSTRHVVLDHNSVKTGAELYYHGVDRHEVHASSRDGWNLVTN